MGTRISIKRLAALGLLGIIAATPASAYVDPNTAGLLYQIFFPLIVAITVAWRRIKDFAFLFWTRIRRILD